MYKTISWNTGTAAMRFRHNLRLKKKRRPRPGPASCKLQADKVASLKKDTMI